MSGVLIIEDEPALAAGLAAVVERLGLPAQVCATGQRGLGAADAATQLVILDIGLPDRSGLEVLRELRQSLPELPVLIITAHGNLDNAVAARQLGASGYLVKPLDLPLLEETLSALLQTPAPVAAPAATPPPTGEAPPLLIGGAPAMQPAFIEIAQACASDAPVLISGSSGSGKSLTARIIHEHSARRDNPLALIDCGSLSGEALALRLFGAEGALSAAHGTVLLERIELLTPSLQQQLAGELQRSRSGCARILSETNRDLKAAIALGEFREDLYYQLRVLEVSLPPLSERLGDLPALCAYLLARIDPQRRLQISRSALMALRGHDWPGNVRELRSALEHGAAVSPTATIQPAHLPREFHSGVAAKARAQHRLDSALAAAAADAVRSGLTYDALLGGIESRLLHQLLPHFDGKPTHLAAAMDMNRVTLRKKMEMAGLGKALRG